MTLWRHLEERLGNEPPRKFLALDGGGIRGLLSLEILVEIEKKIAANLGRSAGRLF
jgi:patatin-like phospholipase/acyl hydrolase